MLEAIPSLSFKASTIANYEAVLIRRKYRYFFWREPSLKLALHAICDESLEYIIRERHEKEAICILQSDSNRLSARERYMAYLTNLSMKNRPSPGLVFEFLRNRDPLYNNFDQQHAKIFDYLFLRADEGGLTRILLEKSQVNKD
jgi:hypothetical protein